MKQLLLCISTIVRLILFICIVFASHTTYAADSEGVEFWTAFLANKGGTQQNANISLTFLNKNLLNSALVNVTYNVNQTTVVSQTITVDVASANTLQLPSYLLYLPVTGGLNQIPSISIYITSTQPIGVIGSNVSPDGTSGDRFVVLPKTMQGNYYVIGGMNQINASFAEQFSEILILITESGTALNYTILPSGGNNNVIVANLGAGTVYKSSFNGEYTAIITSSRPIALIVGASCFAYANGLCDHQSYMPLPLVQSCATSPLDDFYLAGGLFGNRNTYAFAASQQCNTPVFIDDAPNPPRLTPESPVLFSDFTPELMPAQLIHYIAPDLNPILLTRIGQLNDGLGIFFNIVPSTSQFVTGTTLFYSFDSNSSVFMFADTRTIANYTISCNTSITWTYIPGVPGNYYYSTTAIPTIGLCTFTSDGFYSITVFGKTNQLSSYAYVASMNIPRYLLNASLTTTTNMPATTTGTGVITTTTGTGITTTTVTDLTTTTTTGTGVTTTTVTDLTTTTTTGTGVITTTTGTGVTTTTTGTGITTTTSTGTGVTTTTTAGLPTTTIAASTAIGGSTTTAMLTTAGGSTTTTMPGSGTTTTGTLPVTTVTITAVTSEASTIATTTTLPSTTTTPIPVSDNSTFAYPINLTNGSNQYFTWTINISRGVTIMLNVTRGIVLIEVSRCFNQMQLQSPQIACNTTGFCQRFYSSSDLDSLQQCAQRADNMEYLYGLLMPIDAMNEGQLSVASGDRRVSEQPASNKLSTGAIIGIVVGSLLLVLLILVIGYLLYRKYQTNNIKEYRVGTTLSTSG